MLYRRTALLLIMGVMILYSVALGEYTPDPTWKIAFVRESNLWVMNADGTGAKKILHSENITGPLSWSKDGKRIVFSRQGQLTVQNPDGMGGGHKCYDLFVAHVDSAGRNWWWRITDDLGSNSATWSADDKYFVYVNDKSANLANALLPEYRIFYRNWDGSVVKSIAPPNAAPDEYLGLQPSISPDGTLIAYIYVQMEGDKATSMRDVGMVIVPMSGIKRTNAELLAEAITFPNAGGPSFSPDGKTIAYIYKDYNNPTKGIYLVNVADKTKKRIYTPAEGFNLKPNTISWSPDGQWLTFSSYDGYIYVIDRNGQNLKKISTGGNDYFPAFSR